MEKGRATKSHKKGSIIAIEGVGDCPAVEPLLLLSPTHSHRRQQLPHLVDFCLGCGRSVAPCPAASCSSHSIVGEDVAKLPQFPSVPPAGETSSSSSSSMILCAECSTSSRIPLRVCLVDTSNGENEKQKHQDEDSAFFARAQLRRYLQRLAQARGESDGMVAALIAVCSLILSTKAADTMAKLQSSILDTSNNDGDNDDADADDDVIGECWALLLPCNEDDDNDASNTTATASTFLRQGPLAFGRFVQSIRQRCLFWVDATHPVAAYVEKLLPTLSEEDMDVALKSLKPLVDWAFRNDGKVLAKDGQSDVAVPAEKILRYRRVARLAQVMSSQGGGDIMEDGDKMPSPRDELDRHHQVILSEGACLEHSCNPNCVVVCRQGDDDNELLVVQASMSPVGVELLALCDIEEGERLTVSRMDGGGGLDLPVDSRASTLRQIMGSNFSCRCPRCRYERLDRSSKQQIILGDTRDGNENQVFYWKEIKALGDLAMQQGRHEDAEEFYSLVLKTKPDNGDALHARAASYLERGLYCKSQQLWKEAHNIGSTHKEISLAATKQKAYGFSTRTKEHGNEAPTSVSTRNYKVTTLMEGRCFITDRDSPILSPHECKQAIRWAEDASKERPGGWTTSRHYAVPTTDLPVHEIPQLLDFFNDVLANRLRPLMAQQFSQGEVGVEGCGLHVHDAFVVRYDAEGGQRHLPVHTDDSSHSFTIALNDLSDYDGGGTYICSLGESYRSSIGGAFTFRGDQIQHGGDPVVRGTRYVIVGFCYVDKQTVDDADDSNETSRKMKKPKLDEMFRPDRSTTDKGRDNGGGFSFGFSM